VRESRERDRALSRERAAAFHVAVGDHRERARQDRYRLLERSFFERERRGTAGQLDGLLSVVSVGGSLATVERDLGEVIVRFESVPFRERGRR
jgi:hypothetical protein